jgi:hypothetical protein
MVEMSDYTAFTVTRALRQFPKCGREFPKIAK